MLHIAPTNAAHICTSAHQHIYLFNPLNSVLIYTPAGLNCSSVHPPFSGAPGISKAVVSCLSVIFQLVQQSLFFSIQSTQVLTSSASNFPLPSDSPTPHSVIISGRPFFRARSPLALSFSWWLGSEA